MTLPFTFKILCLSLQITMHHSYDWVSQGVYVGMPQTNYFQNLQQQFPQGSHYQQNYGGRRNYLILPAYPVPYFVSKTGKPSTSVTTETSKHTEVTTPAKANDTITTTMPTGGTTRSETTTVKVPDSTKIITIPDSKPTSQIDTSKHTTKSHRTDTTSHSTNNHKTNNTRSTVPVNVRNHKLLLKQNNFIDVLDDPHSHQMKTRKTLPHRRPTVPERRSALMRRPSLPKYGLIPIPNDLAADLIAELNGMDVIQADNYI